MKEKYEKLATWVEEHKIQLLIGGISVISIASIIFGIKNKEVIKELLLDSENTVVQNSSSIIANISVVKNETPIPDTIGVSRTYTIPREAFDVRQHTRMLPNGKHHSMVKAMEAERLGIVLQPNQTIVSAHTKYVA